MMDGVGKKENLVPKSLQDILKLRQREEFVGREEQLAFFQANLTYTPEDPRRRFVVNVSGQGGVGKTWLLRRFSKVAEEAAAVTAYADDAQDDVPGVMGAIAEQFEARGYLLKSFAERYRVYQRRQREIEADPQAPQGFPGVSVRSLAKGGLRLVRLAPVGGMVADLVDEDTVSSLAEDLAAYVTRKIRHKDEIRLVLEPVEVLTPLFLAGLREVAGGHPIALFFDTYERTGDFLDPWLRDLLEGRCGDVPANILIVAAGRDELSHNLWAPYEGALARLRLEPFTREEARQYLARRGIMDERVMEVILRLSGRLPLLVATLAAESPDDPHEVGDPSGEAVERFLKWVEDPQKRQVALDGALPHSLNRDVLAVLAGEEQAGPLFEWLRGMPFVEKRGAAWGYHDVVRAQMLRCKRSESPKGWADLHGRLAGHYEGLRDGLQLGEAGRKDETWQGYALEALYHRLCQAPQAALPTALSGFLVALDAHLSFALRWAEAIQGAGEDAGNAQVQQWGRRLEEGLAAYDEDRYQTTAEMFTALLDKADLEQHSRSVALDWRGYLRYLTGQYPPALADLAEALRLAPDEAEYWTDRGSTYLQMERYEEALADFSRAIELDPADVEALVRRGETYREMGRYALALADFNRAIELEPDDAEAIAGRGWAYWPLERYPEALADFDRVIELAPDDAWAMASRGLTHRLMGQYEQALADFDRAIALDPGDAWAIAHRGETYRLMGCYAEALADFERAIALEPDQDWYLYDRALTRRALGQVDLAQADLTAAIQVARRTYDHDPRDLPNTFNLALYHLTVAEAEEAERLYREALSGGGSPYHIREAIRELDDFLALVSDYPQARAMRELFQEHLQEPLEDRE